MNHASVIVNDVSYDTWYMTQITFPTLYNPSLLYSFLVWYVQYVTTARKIYSVISFGQILLYLKQINEYKFN
jgi:hypothetical protein